MPTEPFDRISGLSAVLSAIAGLFYAVSFLVFRSPAYSGLCLTLFGVLAVAPWLAMYQRIHRADPGFALLAVIFGTTGAIGAAIHGGYDLAIALSPSTGGTEQSVDLPSQADPRGFVTFGFGAVGLGIAASIISSSRVLPRSLAYTGLLSAFLLAILYLARLLILNPAHPLILVPAVLNGFVVGPLFYAWLGYELLSRKGIT